MLQIGTTGHKARIFLPRFDPAGDFVALRNITVLGQQVARGAPVPKIGGRVTARLLRTMYEHRMIGLPAGVEIKKVVRPPYDYSRAINTALAGQATRERAEQAARANMTAAFDVSAILPERDVPAIAPAEAAGTAPTAEPAKVARLMPPVPTEAAGALPNGVIPEETVGWKPDAPTPPPPEVVAQPAAPAKSKSKGKPKSKSRR